MATDAMPARTVRRGARSALARLARAELGVDSFQYEAAAILRRAVGFDWWGWALADPGAWLPTRYVGAGAPLARDHRRFAPLSLARWGAGSAVRPAGAIALSAATRGDLRRDLIWRETLGPAGVGDVLDVTLAVDGVCWGQLHLGRDSSGGWFGEDEACFLTEVAPLLAARLRDVLRVGRAHEDPGAEPGTIILDRELSLVAATDEAWRWIGRLGTPPKNEAEPLPGFIYLAAARVAASGGRPRRPATVRLLDADRRWVVVRVAPLTRGPQAGGYAITLEPARSADLAPLLMRAWTLTPRERDVAWRVIDGLSTDDIAVTLFISAHTVRDHLKSIFGKVGVTRRQDLAAALTGQVPGEMSAVCMAARRCEPAGQLLTASPRRRRPAVAEDLT